MATTKSYRVTSIRTFNGSENSVEQLNEANSQILELQSTITGMVNGTVTSVPVQDNHITSIKDGAFENCSSLDQINFGWIDSFGKRCFKNCSSLVSVKSTFDDPNVGEEAFMGCENLEYIDWATGGQVTFKSVGNRAFSGCYKLKNRISAWNVGEEAFLFCETIPQVSIWKMSGSYAFQGCTSLTTVELLSGFGRIYWGSFKGCTSLTTISGMENVTDVSAEAFYGCSNLESITIPAVLSIGTDAFKGCTKLRNITYLGTVERAEGAFHNLSSDVPATTIQCSDGTYTIRH